MRLELTDELRDVLFEAERIDMRDWRHGYRGRFVFEWQGKHYATWIEVHCSEGWQLGDEIDVVEVEAREIMRKVWGDKP
jgi:hypothetical protein